jgi:hypothetical protein
MAEIDWGTTIGWGVIIALVVVAFRLHGWHRPRWCSKCQGTRAMVQHVERKDGYELYACRLCGTGYVLEPGKKLVVHEQWKKGDGLPEARIAREER